MSMTNEVFVYTLNECQCQGSRNYGLIEYQYLCHWFDFDNKLTKIFGLRRLSTKIMKSQEICLMKVYN